MKNAAGRAIHRALRIAIACAAIAALSGCSLLKTDADLGSGSGPFDISREDYDAFERAVIAQLRRLFPELSEEELAAISGALDFEDVIALRDELEAIRDEVAEFSANLLKSAEERVKDRERALAELDGGFPPAPEAVGRICLHDTATGRGRVELSGVLHGMQSVMLDESALALSIDGQPQDFTLSCLANGPTVDIVFLIDITGSMSNVIDSVRDSVVAFIDIIVSSGLRGTIGVVTFQDTVGVNRTFQQPAPPNGYERSPFFAPVPMTDAAAVAELRRFVNRLEANRGADAPENLAGAIDFARNNVIGMFAGEPNVIGDGRGDPAGTQPFPRLTSERQVFVVFTDVTFHGDDRNERNSSLEAPFVPRDAAEILATLQQTGTVVHVSDPSWSDASLDPARASSVDADYWAIHTGGVGEDRVAGYSLVDLELVVVAEESGLLDITLDKILASSCTLEFEAALEANAEISVDITVQGEVHTTRVPVERY
jgi:hypothetical protein